MYEEAVRDYDEAIKLDANNPVYVFNRADTKHEMERYEEAILDFNLYASSSSKLPILISLLGR